MLLVCMAGLLLSLLVRQHGIMLLALGLLQVFPAQVGLPPGTMFVRLGRGGLAPVLARMQLLPVCQPRRPVLCLALHLQLQCRMLRL